MSPINHFPINMFAVFPVLFLCLFGAAIIFFIVTAIKGVSRWSKNNSQPVLIVAARLISKRTDVSSNFADEHHYTSTFYYITFEVESGSRIELHVSGQEYGMLTEGDFGKLKFQGTRYLGFERSNENEF